MSQNIKMIVDCHKMNLRATQDLKMILKSSSTMTDVTLKLHENRKQTSQGL